MANRNMVNAQSLSRGMVLLPFSFDITNGTVSNLKGSGVQSVTGIGSGVITVLLQDAYFQLTHGQVTIQYSSDMDRHALIGDIDLAAKTIAIKTFVPSTGVKQDFAEVVRVHCLLIMKESTAD